MGFWSFFTLLCLIGFYVNWYGTTKALRLNANISEEGSKLPSLPSYYGTHSFLWLIIPVITLLIFWFFFKPFIMDLFLSKYISSKLDSSFTGDPSMLIDTVKATNPEKVFPGTNPLIVESAKYYKQLYLSSDSYVFISILILGLIFSFTSIKRISFSFQARQAVEQSNVNLLIICSVIAIIRFFEKIPFFDFLFGLVWSPQTAIREDQIASQGAFGAIPIFTGTLLITLVAMFVAIPVGLLSAIYLSDYARPSVRKVLKPLLEILAGIPTVVYGFFAAITVGPFLKDFAQHFGFSVASESALAAGGVMGIMIIPFISSLSDDVINAVPMSLRAGSYAMGATKSETIKRVVLPAALPGIVGAILLAVSRAIGETMIVVMAAGVAANLTANPFESVTTVTVQIVTLLVGDQEFDSAKTLAAFALGITLFFITLLLNLWALKIVRKYREVYD